VIVAQDWRGSYQVQPGDSLYRIARQHEIRVADLQRANSIENPRQLKPGMVLRIPGTAEPSSLPSSTVAAIPGATAPDAPRAIQSSTQPTMINARGERRVAALNTGRITDAGPAPSASWSGVKPVQTVAITPSQIGTNSLRWPSKGKVLSGFGQRADGTHNDGINIAVPKGTDVHAAAEGEVAYAGSELKGYGNLILLRHDNGWVTAYAHADQLLVKRGDKVRRGDVIAKAGNTGQVDQPQLHFELRQGSKPVDPLPYLDRL
jgi:murein DD-endopeptidase MepM/ murein hydrolase activator NlpD